ncbi:MULTISPECIES: LuxR family transcriptional regulator [unclassified Streptomyces]|uniref:LuxR family transcriptional regulator n=1 Tax=unclassified Streptomyces TaxID=2593676 RepID=UPI00345012F7
MHHPSLTTAADTEPIALSDEARSMYIGLLQQAGAERDESPGSGTAEESDGAVARELIASGLVAQSGLSPKQLSVVDPQIVEARMGAALRSKALLLLEQAADLSEFLSPLIAVARESTVAHSGEPIVHLEGKAVISSFISNTVNQCGEELLTAQPGGGRAKATLSAIRAETVSLLDRGVSVRTLYQHTAWHDRPTRDYVSEVTELGAEVRTLDEFFDRLVIADRRIAFIPADAGRDRAVVIRDLAIVRFLSDLFDRNWLRAKVFVGSRTPQESMEISSALRETIIRCLIDGDSDSQIAKRIGLSTRAYASHLAKLKEEFGVETRFQLGYSLARREKGDS